MLIDFRCEEGVQAPEYWWKKFKNYVKKEKQSSFVFFFCFGATLFISNYFWKDNIKGQHECFMFTNNVLIYHNACPTILSPLKAHPCIEICKKNMKFTLHLSQFLPPFLYAAK